MKGAEAIGLKKKSISLFWLLLQRILVALHKYLYQNGKVEFCKTPNKENSNEMSTQGKEEL